MRAPLKTALASWAPSINIIIIIIIIIIIPLIKKVNKLITNEETRDDNNNRRVTVTVKGEPNQIKHCEINNGQSVELNIVFAS